MFNDVQEFQTYVIMWKILHLYPDLYIQCTILWNLSSERLKDRSSVLCLLQLTKYYC